MQQTLLYIGAALLAIYFFFCLRYALYDALGKRAKAEVGFNDGALCYTYQDQKGQGYRSSGGKYLPTIASQGDEVDVIYLPFMPGSSMLAGWLSIRFRQVMVLGLVSGVIGGGIYAFTVYMLPAVETQWAKRNDPNNHFLNPISGPLQEQLNNPPDNPINGKPIWDNPNFKPVKITPEMLGYRNPQGR